MSLILVATVSGVLLDESAVARRTDAWGYAGAEPGTRPATVRGPPTAVFSRPLCQTAERHRSGRRTGAGQQGLLAESQRHTGVPEPARRNRSPPPTPVLPCAHLARGGAGRSRTDHPSGGPP